jgi:flagellar L-ring protein FlgH
MQPSNSSLALALALIVTTPASARKEKRADEAYAPTLAQPTVVTATANGAIIRAEYYQPLTAGTRAGMVGDVLIITLVERMTATKSTSSSTDRGGDFGLTLPSTGPFSLAKPSDVAMGGKQAFKGKGEASQSNTLSGEISVTVAAVYPNGTMLVRGEKQLTLNRGDERIQISGLVRLSDITADNRVFSTQIADARIRYTGKGEVARASKQGWLQRLFSKVSPF